MLLSIFIIFSDKVEQDESPVDIMARRSIDVFHNSVIRSQVTSNTNNELVMPSSTVRNDMSKISTWDGLADMDVEEALVRTSMPLFSSLE